MLQVRIGAAAVILAMTLNGGARAQTGTSGSSVNVGTLSSSPISQPTGGTISLATTPSSSPLARPATGGGSTVNLGTTLAGPAPGQPGSGDGTTVSLATAVASPAISQPSAVSTGSTGGLGTTPSTPASGQTATVRAGSTIGLGTTPNTTAISQPSGGTTGSAGCAAITQAAANGLIARINADNLSINPPRSVTTMTCLSNFFNGVGLNVITNLLDPQLLLQTVEYQICNAVQAAWNSTIGQIQCGLTLTGFNLGFGGLGGGLICPRISFGGGGAPIESLGFGFGSNPGLYINGNGLPPAGYNLTNVPRGTY